MIATVAAIALAVFGFRVEISVIAPKEAR